MDARLKAQQAGEKKYYGYPCLKDKQHINSDGKTLRYVKSNACWFCVKENNKTYIKSKTDTKKKAKRKLQLPNKERIYKPSDYNKALKDPAYTKDSVTLKRTVRRIDRSGNLVPLPGVNLIEVPDTSLRRYQKEVDVDSPITYFEWCKQIQQEHQDSVDKREIDKTIKAAQRQQSCWPTSNQELK